VLPANHLARFVVDIIARLDLSEVYALSAAVGEWCLICLAVNLKHIHSLFLSNGLLSPTLASPRLFPAHERIFIVKHSC